MKASAAAVLACLSAVASAEAQQPVQLNQTQVQALQTAIANGDLTTVLGVLTQQCDTHLSESQSSTASVTERAESAREALLCAEQTASAAAFVAPAQNFLQVRDLLNTAVGTYQANLQARESEEQFLGLRWGLGLGFSIGRDEAVSEAEIVNGTVRVTAQQEQRPRAVLEYHKYFWCHGTGSTRTTGCGPFVAVAATEDKVLSGVGIGFMYGRKASANDNDGFSLGLGFVLDDNVKDVGVGFAANEPAPTGATSVRFTTKARWSFLVFVTRTF